MVCIAWLDIDHFTRVCDVCGHCAEDRVLQEFASIAMGVVREGEVFARRGGEEFLWVMTGKNPNGAIHAVDRLRALVGSSACRATQPGWPISFSAGVAPRDPRESIEQALRQADGALYRAKVGGRAQTLVH